MTTTFHLDAFWAEVEREIRRRVLADCGGGRKYGRQTRRQLEDGIEVGFVDAWLHDATGAYLAERRRAACRRGTDRAKNYLAREARRSKCEVAGAFRLADALVTRTAEGFDISGGGGAADFEFTTLTVSADIPVLAKLELQHIAALVEVLDHPQRTAIKGRYWYGKSWEAIAREMSRRVPAVKDLHDCALVELRWWLR